MTSKQNGLILKDICLFSCKLIESIKNSPKWNWWKNNGSHNIWNWVWRHTQNRRKTIHDQIPWAMCDFEVLTPDFINIQKHIRNWIQFQCISRSCNQSKYKQIKTINSFVDKNKNKIRAIPNQHQHHNFYLCLHITIQFYWAIYCNSFCWANTHRIGLNIIV